ncbi:MAG: mechanosensitive ion channel family protein, partial [Balneolaceae bacterium]
NFTSNPNQQTRFTVGIGCDDSIITAQNIGAEILANHPAVLKEPEPWILVDELAASTINLQFYFWVDGHRHNLLKVKSSVLRLIKTAYYKEGISMPDEAREMIFPKGVPVQLQEEDDEPPSSKRRKSKRSAAGLSDDLKVTTEAEGQLGSNDEEIQEQARRSRSPETGEDLLKP